MVFNGRNHRAFFVFTIVFIFVLGTSLSPYSLRADVTPISPSEMSTITGREGIIIDMNFSSGFTIDDIDYSDADGAASASGTSGTIRFDNVCMELSCNASSLNGLTLDFSSSVVVNSTSQPAVVINLPTSSGFGVDVLDVYLGDPAGSPAFSNLGMSGFLPGGTDLELAAQSDGFIADIELNMTMNNVQLDDASGWSGSSGTSGTLNVGSLTLDNGSGGQANLEGMTVDTTNSIDLDGTNTSAVVVGMPSGGMHLDASNVDVSGNQYTSNVNVNGLEMAGTTVEMGAH